MKRARVVRKVATVEVGTARDQQSNGGMLVTQCGQVQSGGFLKAIAAQCIDQIGAGIKALAQRGNVPRLCRPHNGLKRLPLNLGARVSALHVTREQLESLITMLLGDLVDRAAIAVASCRVEPRREGTADRLDITGPGRVEHPIALAKVCIDGLNMRLERAPAFEAIRVGYGELRLMQPCIRFGGAQGNKALLGGFPEPVEVGIRRQGQRHGTPSFSVPADRNSGKKEGGISAQCCRGGLNPLRGPSVASSTGPKASLDLNAKSSFSRQTRSCSPTLASSTQG